MLTPSFLRRLARKAPPPPSPSSLSYNPLLIALAQPAPVTVTPAPNILTRQAIQVKEHSVELRRCTDVVKQVFAELKDKDIVGLNARAILKRVKELQAKEGMEPIRSMTFLKDNILSRMRQTREIKSVPQGNGFVWAYRGVVVRPKRPESPEEKKERERRADVAMRLETAHLNRRRQRKRLEEMRA